MASYSKPSRATCKSESGEDPCCAKCNDKKKPCDGCCKPSSAVEHVVLFNMPFLQGDQEAKILHAMYDLQFQCDSEALVVGRVLNKVENVTHALYMRFATVELLKDYYRSEALSKVVCSMLPHIHGEIVVDYVSACGHLDTNFKEPTCVTVTLLRRKRDVCPPEMDCSLHSLKTLADAFCFMKDFTVGSNLFICGDKHYTNGFMGFVQSVCDLDKLEENLQYTKLLHHKVLPLSCSTITVNMVAFKPVRSCL